MVIHEGVISWNKKPPSNVRKRPSVPVGEGEYANLPDGLKLYKKAKRRIAKYAVRLLSTTELPRWLITLNYPNKQARNLTAEKLKRSLTCVRKFFERAFPERGFSYSIDFEKRAKHHIHILVWDDAQTISDDPFKAFVFFYYRLRTYWLKHVESQKINLINLRYMPTEEEAISIINYLLAEKKVKAQMPVIGLVGRKSSFGFFNQKNIPFTEAEIIECSPEEFDEIVREMLLADLESSEHGSNTKKGKHQKRKIKEAQSHRHRFHDRKKAKALKRKLRKRRRRS